VFDDLKKLRGHEPPVYGLEYATDCLLLLCRRVSISYWIRRPSERPPLNLKWRSRIIDWYCCGEFAVLCCLLVWSRSWSLSTALSVYILFEIYLSLFNIVFIGKFPSINYTPASIERVILLMFLNVLQVLLAFAVLYHTWSPSYLSGHEALSQAVRILGTIAAPEQPRLIVDLQILLDLLLLVIFLASFAGQISLFRKPSGSEKESQQ
jgi:hypothetical protein